MPGLKPMISYCYKVLKSAVNFFFNNGYQIYWLKKLCDTSLNNVTYNFHSRSVHLDIIKVLLPTDAQENSFKRSIKIYIKAAPNMF